MLEADLDIEWAGAVARKSTIYYVYARSVRTSLQYAIDQNIAPILTYSYGSCELGINNSLRYLAQQANAQGITFMAASGDAGAATCDYFSSVTPQAAKGTTMSYPANVPEVTAVGGTQFNEGTGSYWSAANDANFSSALSAIPETVWNEVEARNDLVSVGRRRQLVLRQALLAIRTRRPRRQSARRSGRLPGGRRPARPLPVCHRRPRCMASAARR